MTQHPNATDGASPLAAVQAARDRLASLTRAPAAGEGARSATGGQPDSAQPANRDRPAAREPQQATPRIIAMLNQKGGVGKTTSTVNLGAALAEAGQRVCLLDLDPQAHLTFHLGIDPDDIPRSMYDLLTDPQCYASEAIINARPNLDVVLSETDLAAAETELANVENRQVILRDKFASMASAYDVVLLDCPPSLGLLTLNALALAGEVFVPMQAHFLALQGVGKLLETVGLVCQSINPSLRVSGIILCMHEHQTTLAKEIVSDLDAFFTDAASQDVPWSSCKVLRPPIRRNVKLAEAPSFGKTIFDYEPWCPGALDYRMLARELLTAWGRPIQPLASASPAPPAPARATIEHKPPKAQPAAVVEIAMHDRQNLPAGQ
jgi:chromosome partitioning protein